VGIIGFVMAWIFVPRLQTHPHRFDYIGVVLSAAALFLIVFGLQEGQKYDWGVITGPITVWGMIAAGIVLLIVFVLQQWKTKSEALVPLGLFKDRNFSASNLGIAAVGFTVTSMSLPFMFFLQLARGLTPTEAALLLIPMAVISGVLAPFAGSLLDRVDPRFILIPGLLCVAGGVLWNSSLMNMDTPTWMFLLPSALLGIGNAGMWGPLATEATRNLPPRQAGAGAGIYNTTRTIGSVVGSSAIAAFMQARLEANLPGLDQAPAGLGAGGKMPDAVADGFSAGMSQSMLLPVSVMVVALIAALFIGRYKGKSADELR
jgi:MFS family permease